MTELSNNNRTEAHYSDICKDACGGACCDPWWGIISYPLLLQVGTQNQRALHNRILGSIKEREERIRGTYVTKEAKPERLFGAPERYNVSVQNIAVEGSALIVTILAMFSFRCKYLGDSKECTIHPSLSEEKERDIRPDQCGFLGVPGVGPGEKGYCRIIFEAGTEATEQNALKIEEAVKKERSVSAQHQLRGVETAQQAADKIMTDVNRYIKQHSELQRTNTANRAALKVGRNDPCSCGSGKKYKKCCGS